jgi:putative heme-binding domain-containing protein
VGRAGDLFTLLAADHQRRGEAEYRALLESVAEQAGLQSVEAQVLMVLKSIDGLNADDRRLAQAVVRGLYGGLAKSSSPLRQTLGGGGAQAAKVLADLVKQSQRAALDEKLSVERRVEAVESLSLGSYAEIGGTLAELLAASQPKEIQLAALSTLARFAQPEAAHAIVAAWPGLTPTVRSEALEVLLARREWVHVLLDAVKDKAVGAGQIDPARVQVLLAHPDQQIRTRARQLLAGEKLSRRQDVITAYRGVLKMTGDPAKGKTVFKRDCSTCHRLENVGFDLGLPLTTVGGKGAEYILVNVLDPNLTVLPEYVNYQIITKDGRTFTGMIAAETATSITLRRAEGQSDTVLRANIDEMQSTGLSLMPEGLEKQVSQPDMADLIAYLMSLK